MKRSLGYVEMTGPDRQLDTTGEFDDPINSLPIKCAHCTFPDIDHVPLESGDRLLLCTDGLSGYVDDPEIEKIIRAAQSPQDACRQLIAAANANGGPDNITAIIIQLEALE